MNEHNKLSVGKSTKEVWNKLEITYEWTSQVKETRINLQFRDYELFQMNADEIINDLNNKFTDIMNWLKLLRKDITKEEMMKKFLRSSLEKWETKVIVLSDTNNLTRLHYDEFDCTLQLHMNLWWTKERIFYRKISIAFEGNEDGKINAEKEMNLTARRMKRFTKLSENSKRMLKLKMNPKRRN